MNLDELKAAIIEFEKKEFFEETHLCALRPDCNLSFTEVGRYDEIMEHIREHKWYMNLKHPKEIPFSKALLSWYDNVYMPIVRIIRESKLLSRFPNATESDLYVFIGKHWSELSKRYGSLFTLEEAAEDFSRQSRLPRLTRAWRRLRGLVRRLTGRTGGRIGSREGESVALDVAPVLLL